MFLELIFQITALKELVANGLVDTATKGLSRESNNNFSNMLQIMLLKLPVKAEVVQ